VNLYGDTSFLFSYYASDVHSSRADHWRQANSYPLLFSLFNRVELRNAIELAVFQSRLTPTEAAEIWLTVENDLKAGYLVLVQPSMTDLLRDAEVLAAAHTSSIGTRSLDILHVAMACLLKVDEFVTFDQRQTVLVKRLGLKAALI
jgi:predicted nucleic acid-binding protein